MPTCSSPWDCGNDTGSIVINPVVRNELLVRQDDGDDPGIVSIEAGREHHTIQQQGGTSVIRWQEHFQKPHDLVVRMMDKV